MTRATTQLRRLIEGPQLDAIIEAHSGVSAKLVEQAGAKGIWASGLAISSALGLRDCNEASWTQVLDVIEYMVDGTSIPILVDGDSGYGNFNNFRRFVSKLQQRGAGGVCIEDKSFPKSNSFLEVEQQLIGVDEFCGKIKAAKDILEDPDFVIVARIESFIVGTGLDDALTRAHAYKQAGADAIFIHSKKSNADEIESFTRAWGSQLPVVIAPTTYFRTPLDRFADMRVSVVIWANHLVRASVHAMQSCAEHLVKTGSPIGMENRLVAVSDVFKLTGVDELMRAEQMYSKR